MFVRNRGVGRACPDPFHSKAGTRSSQSRRLGSRAAEEGAAAVEFAFVTTLIVVVAWGVIQFGVVYNRYQGLQAAGREGARYAAQSQATIGQIQDKVKKALEPVIDADASYVDPCPSDPKTMLSGEYCINVARRNSFGASPTLYTIPGYKPTTQPCNLATGKTVIVTVYHSMKVAVPLWAAGTVKASGAGEFKCES